VRRRDLMLSLAALMLAPGRSGAQQTTAKIPRIGILSPGEQSSTLLYDAFREGLRDLGWVEGHNIVLEFRLSAGDFSRLPAMADELVRLPVDLIVTDGGPGVVSIAHQATRTIPIVAAAGDPVEAGVAESWAHPGGNVTGFRLQSPELSGKRLQLLKEASPTIQRVAALWNSAAIGTSRLTSTEEAARALGLQLRTIEIATPERIAAGFEAATAAGADGLYVLPATMFFDHREQIIALAAKTGLPAIGPGRSFAVAGGLLSYGPKGTDLFRGAAVYVDKILKGANPGDLPIQQPTKYELVVNLKTAKALGLTIPQSILDRADEVIE
jgi:putative tryptophan/tyrosine transport system substrate-binding protein